MVSSEQLHAILRLSPSTVLDLETIGIAISADPVGDVRRRLERLLALGPEQSLRMLKYVFVDVRAKCASVCARLCECVSVSE